VFRVAPKGMLQLKQRAENLPSAPWRGFWSQKPSPGLPASSPNPPKGTKATPSKLPAPNAGVDPPGKKVRLPRKQFFRLQDLFICHGEN